MAKAKTAYVCSECGGESSKWQGQCPECGAWNTLSEISLGPGRPNAAAGRRSGYAGGASQRARPTPLAEVATAVEQRFSVGIGELNRVLGGGLVEGSVVLIGGDPGIGKSTLLTQAAAALANHGHRIVYVSCEEAVAQIRLRAQLLGVASSYVELAA